MSQAATITGHTLGRYHVLERLGAGGMGDVYRARDDSLNRDVAIKILHAPLADDPGGRARFEKEARATAALNHPNIVAIYDFGYHQGSPYLVCELLEGETLRMRLLRGTLAPDVAIEYTLQITDALAAAHQKGIVHRDLKPENVFVTRSGAVKVLDFGIAKLTQEDSASPSSDELETALTRPGSWIGTMGYASPEQLRGRAVDARSDIFSLGAMLFEMVTGRRAFRGSSSADTTTAVLTEDPLQALAPRPAAPLERVIRHCLEKDPEHRFQCARDLAFDLTGARELEALPPRAVARAGHRPWLLAAASLTLIAAAVLLWALGRRPSPAPEFRRLTFQRGTVYAARFSPDQETVVYAAAWEAKPNQIYTAASRSPSAQPLELRAATLLAVSKSGELALSLRGQLSTHLVFLGGVLARAPISGVAPREMLRDVRWADWGPNGELAVVHHSLGRSRLEYPIGKVLYDTAGWISHIRFSPAGDHIAFLDHPTWSDDRGSVAVLDLAGRKTVLSTDWESEDGLAWTPDGKEIWFTATVRGYSRALFAVDLARKSRLVLRVPGSLTLQDIARDGRVLTSFEDERFGIVGAAAGQPEQDLSWLDSSLVRDISPDGAWVLFEENSEAAGTTYAVAMRKLDGSPPIRLGEGTAGGFSPDGKWVASIVTGKPERIVLLPTEAGEPRTITVPGIEHYQNGAARFLPDGKHLLINASEPGHSIRTYLQPLDSGTPRPVTPEALTALLPSPDGKYTAGLGPDGKMVIYSLEGAGARALPGVAPGYVPVQWSSDGKSIFVCEEGRHQGSIYRVDITSGRSSLVRTVTPSDPAGLVNVGKILATPDTRTYAYSYYRVLSVLYIIAGLR